MDKCRYYRGFVAYLAESLWLCIECVKLCKDSGVLLSSDQKTGMMVVSLAFQVVRRRVCNHFLEEF